MQVTTKANANIVQIGYPDWSPDGSSVAFSGYAASISAPADIFRIRVDGSQKAVNLTGASSDSFLVPLWRS